MGFDFRSERGYRCNEADTFRRLEPAAALMRDGAKDVAAMRQTPFGVWNVQRVG